ncbi:DUF1016 N-terminal domain-containing protein [Arthrobacter castelli]|uniref:DUF1016 N-terminal domain-containing protein n=1 Tax=Arthrobacter castelli TaxID=271431 RepID=UPI001FE02E28|nr:DUF1016 N-terminal domain-containing protein [Arthrobacter castelli]
MILQRQDSEGWGTKVIDRLAEDLKSEFPDTKGLSPRNLKYMRSFAEAWPDFGFVQRVAQLPWRHHIALVQKLTAQETRLWYALASIENGWSHDVLVHQIETRLHERAGKAISNFEATMPPSDSDLAQQATKDPYIFDFVAMTDRRKRTGSRNPVD